VPRLALGLIIGALAYPLGVAVAHLIDHTSPLYPKGT